MRAFPFFTFVLIVFGSCGLKENETKQHSDDLIQITELADTYVELAIKYFPENYAYFSLKDVNYSSLSDNSLAGLEKWNLLVDSLYNRFQNLSVEHEVGSESWYLYGFLREALETEVQTRDCKTEFTTVNHLSGWHISFGRLAANQPVGDDKAKNEAIKRWNQLPQYIDNEIANLRAGVNQGYTVPKAIVTEVIKQLEEMLEQPITTSQFYSPASRDTSKVFKERWTNIVINVIYPSIKKYQDFLKKEYYPAARSSISIADLPNGKEAYEAYYRYFTSVKRKTEEIIEISNYRLKVNNSKLRLYGRERYGNDSIPQVLNKIIRDTTHYFNSRNEMIRFAEESVIKAKEKCKIAFDKLPSQKVEIKAIPENSQSIGSHYIPAIGDTSKPSYYYINLHKPSKMMRGELETEIFHETFPGHHLQIGLEVEKKSKHLITHFFAVNGYTEGWASYAQILADELGLYETGYSRFFVLGRSSRIMHLEAMIHSGKWNRKQAIDYLLTHGTHSTEAAEQIINRIIVWPGQFSTYDTGLVEILELREKAMLTLGDDFDIKEFHRIVLEGGAIPLEMLREKVNWWLERKMGK